MTFTTDIKTSVNSQAKTAATITISLDRMPEHCGECPLYISTGHFDEDAMWGDHMVYKCPFGCENKGCLVERPSNCPLIPQNIASGITFKELIELRQHKYDGKKGTEAYNAYTKGWFWAYQDMKEILEQHGFDMERKI